MENFLLENSGPFVSLFYYVEFSIRRCLNCGNVINCDTQQFNFFLIDLNSTGKISELIHSVLVKKSKYPPHCKNCANKNNIISKYFLNLPPYLIFYFSSKNKTEKILDNEIDLSPYYITGEPSKKYNLVSFILEGNFDLYIKEQDSWLLYKDFNTIDNCLIEKDYKCIPHLIIYKKQD